jgi:hypothetical protein
MAKATGGYQGISGTTPEGSTPDARLDRLEERIAQLEGALIRLTERVDQLAGGGSTARGGYQGVSGNP